MSGEIRVRSGKGDKDRVTMLPAAVKEPLQRHLDLVRKRYEIDLKGDYAGVSLPYALEGKYRILAKNGVGNGFSPPQVCISTASPG